MALCDINGKPITAPSDSNILTQRFIENPNLANPSKFTVGVLNISTGALTAHSSYNATDFIPVTPGKIMSGGFIQRYRHNPWFEATEWCEYCGYYVFFADDKTSVVSGGEVDLAQGSMTGVEVPENAAYVRVCWSPQGYFNPVQTPEKCFVHLADAPTTTPMYWYADNIEKAYIPNDIVGYTYQPPYFGKKWVLFGDSLTDACAGKGWDEESNNVGGVGWAPDNLYSAWTGQLWASRIASELGLSIDNRAKSGSNINDGANGNYTEVSGIKILDAYIAEIEAGTIECADYITIGFGSNTRTDQIGTNEDNGETKTSVYGAMKYFIEKLRYLQRYHNQNMVFGFVLPPQSSWGTGNTRITEGRTAMLEVLNTDEYAVPYCDMWKESGICLDQMADGIHVYTIESNNLYYHAMRRFMMGL